MGHGLQHTDERLRDWERVLVQRLVIFLYNSLAYFAQCRNLMEHATGR